MVVRGLERERERELGVGGLYIERETLRESVKEKDIKIYIHG